MAELQHEDNNACSSSQSETLPLPSNLYDPLLNFKNNNPHAELGLEDKKLYINKPWGRDDVRIKVDMSDTNFVESIDNLQFDPCFDAIIHIKKNMIEFVYDYLDPAEDKDIIDRSFKIHYNSQEYNCFFAEPTQELFAIARAFERNHWRNDVLSLTQIFPFKDSQNTEDMSGKKKSFYSALVPRSFFIQSSNIQNVDFPALVRHINFLIRYYDRNSPLISIKPNLSPVQCSQKKPLQYIQGEFPSELIIRPIDDVVLRLHEVAASSESRFSFIYHYQVLEYVSHYYMDDKAKSALRRLLKDPTIINCSEDKFSDFFATLIDLNHHDDAKMKKVIEEHCDPRIIWRDILNNKTFFCEDIHFEGGFVLKALIAKDTTEDTWCKMWSPKLYDTLTKIRNALVHARERREDKSIMPTLENHRLLEQYRPIIQRVSEQVTFSNAG